MKVRQLFICISLVLTACSQQMDPLANIQKGQVIGGATKQIANAQPVGGFLPNAAMLQPGGTGDPDLIYRSPSALPSSYSRVLLEPVTVWSGPGSNFSNLPPAQRQALANRFATNLRQTLRGIA